jgi:preprotein translocase subunit SecA
MKKISSALSRARGVPIIDDLRDLRVDLERTRSHDHSGLTDAALTEAAGALRARVAADLSLDWALPECFALAAEASRRRLGLDPFDEQLLAGIAMHRGMLAQMQTGEGKTLAAVFPASLAALAGRGVHVLTANDYLARRDARWMGPVYDLMGLRAAFVGEGMDAAQRRAAYAADVTYLTAREAGFDYLRDGLAADAGSVVHRAFWMVIVDEADFLLIDEARVPLVIAGTATGDGVDARRVDALASALRPGKDFTVDREGRRIQLLPAGHTRVEESFGVAGIHDEAGAPVFARVHAALHARHLLQRDVDYVVKDGRIGLVDGFTGRVAERRQWPWGVQAALEAREGLELQAEGTVYGSITIQDFIGLYEKRAAMTATAVPSAPELFEVYGLPIAIIPTVAPCRRVDEPDRLFATRGEKDDALVAEITRAHGQGTPVLVGTGSVRESQELAGQLSREGVACEVLNARNDEKEAELIAAAGRRGAVTISTNMAGRGTDIRLGDDELVRARGGLRVLGTNRHESRRIDDQLRGRAGRQGEPGSSRFFVSLEDPLFERYGVAAFLPRGVPLDDPRVLREVDRAQSIIEAQNHAIRRALRKYARLVELDRRTVRSLRDDALLRRMLPAELEALDPSPAEREELVGAFLCLLDELWASHLLLAEEVREGIDLERFAGRDPGLEYIHRVGGAFETGLAGITTTILDAWARRSADPGALSLRSLGVARPSSTWTYQVDDEGPQRSRLGMIGGSEIATALAAGPSFLLNTALAAGAAVATGVKGLRERRRKR